MGGENCPPPAKARLVVALPVELEAFRRPTEFSPLGSNTNTFTSSPDKMEQNVLTGLDAPRVDGLGADECHRVVEQREQVASVAALCTYLRPAE